jgi:hypothetical protein
MSLVDRLIKMIVATSSTNVSGTEDDEYPLTPQSKQSCSACYVARSSDGIKSLTPNCFPKIDNTNTFSLHPMITSFEEQHYFDRFLGRPANDKHSL